MTARERDKVLMERRLLRASEHVNNFWFPVNAELHSRIRSLVKGDADRALSAAIVVEEVRGDPALFLYCLREIAATLRDEGVEIPLMSHPFELLEWAGVERLKKVLDIEPAKISPHSLERAHLFQKIGIEEALISASASQVLSEKVGIAPEVAFTTALLRQLGYALIAWNYAGVYHQALQQVRPSEPLDALLTRMLGFSPTTLAMVVINSWGLPSYIQRAVSPEGGKLASATPENVAITQSLVKICRIGESLARANHPEVHPSARYDWQSAKTQIEEILGKQGLEQIQAQLVENAHSYVHLLPQVFKGSFVLDPESKIRSDEHRASFDSNPFVAQCAPELRAGLQAIYLRMGTDEVTSLVRSLVRDIIPSSRFKQGAVYTVDPGVAWLVPQLGIGGVNIAALKPCAIYQTEQDTDIISKAFNGTDVIVGSVNNADVPQAFLARSLGYSQRYGVLYLETRQMLNELLTNTTRAEFNAIALTLTDCLTLIR